MRLPENEHCECEEMVPETDIGFLHRPGQMGNIPHSFRIRTEKIEVREEEECTHGMPDRGE